MFEQEYKQANDRIHPRQELLQELEEKWAAQQAQPEETGKVVTFPLWARYMSIAAGVVLCIGVGMGSMLLLGRSRGARMKTAQAPQMAESAVQEEMILTEATMESAAAGDEALADGMLFEAKAAPAAQAPQGLHRAEDEAEVEEALLFEAAEADSPEAEVEAPAADSGETEAPEAEENRMKGAALNASAKSAAAEEAEVQYPAGQIFLRDDIMAVFMPTQEKVRVLRYASGKVSSVFTLNPKEKDAQIQKVFWLGNEMLIVREKGGETELMRFDVADWNAPRHRRDLVQSGTFLAAAEMNGRLYVLSLYRATDEEPLPWVDGSRIDFANVLLDSERPGDVYTVITVYDPETDGFAAQTALLREVRGALVEADRLLLWTEEDETDFIVLSGDETGLGPEAESALVGTVLDAGLVGEDFSILMQTGEDLTLLTLDRALNEQAAVSARAAGRVRFAAVYEGGALALTDGGLHYLTEAGDSVLDVTGDGFCWLSPDRGLVLSEDGRLQAVALNGYAMEALGTAQVKESLVLAVEDTSRIGFDLGSGRLVFPAQQRVYEFILNEAGELVQRGSAMNFYDQEEADLRELRCLVTEDRAFVFYKAGVILCDRDLGKISTTKY